MYTKLREGRFLGLRAIGQIRVAKFALLADSRSSYNFAQAQEPPAPQFSLHNLRLFSAEGIKNNFILSPTEVSAQKLASRNFFEK